MTVMKASEIRLVWCENHGGLLMGGLVHSATTSCVKVPMRLIPDVETVESKPKCSACAFEDHEEHWEYGIRR